MGQWNLNREVRDAALLHAREIVALAGFVRASRFSECEAAEIRSRWWRRRDRGLSISRGLENPACHQDVKEFVR
jgi:hypothetical protein